MISAYVNYPNPHVTIHATASCGSIEQQNKPGQRVVQLNIKTLSDELQRFDTKEYRFGSDQATNDMWLYVEFNDAKFERAVVEYIRKLLANHYSPFERVKVNEHC